MFGEKYGEHVHSFSFFPISAKFKMTNMVVTGLFLGMELCAYFYRKLR